MEIFERKTFIRVGCHHVAKCFLTASCVYVEKCILVKILNQQYLLPWSAPETVWVKLVGMKDVDGTFDAEMMQLTGDLQSQQVILKAQEEN